MSLATMGTPAAIASAVTMPNDSPPVFGEQNTSTECRHAHLVFLADLPEQHHPVA